MKDWNEATLLEILEFSQRPGLDYKEDRRLSAALLELEIRDGAWDG